MNVFDQRTFAVTRAVGLAAVLCICACDRQHGDRAVTVGDSASNRSTSELIPKEEPKVPLGVSAFETPEFTIRPEVVPVGMRTPVVVQGWMRLQADLSQPAITLELLSPDGSHLADVERLTFVDWPGRDELILRTFKLISHVFPESRGVMSFRLRIESEGTVAYSEVARVRSGTPGWNDQMSFLEAFQEQLFESYEKHLETADRASAAEAVLAEARADRRVQSATLNAGGTHLSIDYEFGAGGGVMLVHPP